MLTYGNALIRQREQCGLKTADSPDLTSSSSDAVCMPDISSCLAPFFQHRTDVSAQVATQLQQSRNYAAKEIQFGSEGRASMQRGVERLANAVQVTLGPKVSTTRDSGIGTRVTILQADIHRLYARLRRRSAGVQHVAPGRLGLHLQCNSRRR